MIVSVAVAGASGRLGSLISSVVRELDGFELVAELGRNSQPSDWESASVLIDATTPDVSPDIVAAAIERGQSVIVATSGWSEDRINRLRQILTGSPELGVLIVPNFSLGSVLGTILAEIAAPFFESVEVIETHHPHKVDSPSGTAVRTAELIAAARPKTASSAPFADQDARGELVAGVPVHSLRMSGVLAKQEVRFGGDGETLTLTHDTQSADSYRAGIRAALAAIRTQKGLKVGLAEIMGIK